MSDYLLPIAFALIAWLWIRRVWRVNSFRRKYGARVTSCRICEGKGCHYYTKDEVAKGIYHGSYVGIAPPPGKPVMTTCSASFNALGNSGGRK